MGWTRSKAWATGHQSQVETFAGASLPAPWGSNSSSNGVVDTQLDANATTVTDQAGKPRRSITNALGQLIRVDEPNSSNELGSVTSPNQATSYAYDTLNNLITVNQGSQQRDFTYSSISRLRTAANPESGTITYTYDANGNLTSKVDARSITTSYVYDALNRVTDRDYSDSTPDVDYFYGTAAPKFGKLTKVQSSVSTTEYTSFDILGRVTGQKQTTDGQQYTTGYTYNLAGALIEETYPSGRVVKNTLDTTGDLQQVQSKESGAPYVNYANSFAYNAAGAVTAMRLGNGRWESTGFNSRLQPTQIGLGNSTTDTSQLKLEYGYGSTANNGNVLSQTITVPGITHPFAQAYTYDELNRLKSATEINNSTQTWKQTYTFDRYGNRRFDFASGNTTFPASSCTEAICNPTISTSTNRLTSTGWLYDNAGNTTRDGNYQTFTYDAENKQVEVKNSSSVTLGQYWYDGDGKRVKKIVPATGEVTVFVYDAVGKLVAEYSTIVADEEDAKVAYLTNDHLGSPRINTDATGIVSSRHDYHPYGEEIITAQRTSHDEYTPDSVRKQFTGYERDGETDLDFAQARMYGHFYGRFSAPDDFLNDTTNSDPASWNLYAYVRNNPLRYTDPAGEELRIAQKKGKDGKIVSTVEGEDREQLLGGLNHVYGCSKCVTIDKDGYIRLDTAGLDKKTLAVTKDLTSAIQDKANVIGIIGVNGDDNVKFAQAHPGGQSINGKLTDVIRIDFKDFKKLSGDREAISSFSNYAFAHEALHFYPHVRDDSPLTADDPTGPVENAINEMRYVRGDLLRSDYSATTRDGISTMNFGRAKTVGKTTEPQRNKNGGLVANGSKIVRWQKNLVSSK